MSTKIEFTIYLDDDKTTKAFQAIVASQKKYDITYDPNKLYEHMFEEIVNGKYEIEYIEYIEDERGNVSPKMDIDGIPEYKTFRIDGNDSIENITKFIEFQESFGEFTCDVNEEPEIYPIFGIHLNGHEFGYGEDMMSPDTIAKTIISVQKISNAAMNNTNYKKYLREEAASYEVHIDTTKRDENVINLFTEIYDSIESSNLSRMKYQDNSSHNAYRTIINEFGKLTSHRKLTTFSVFIDGIEKEVTNIKYLKNFLTNPYSDDEIEYIGRLKSPDYVNRTFELKTYNNFIWHCHFDDGAERYFDVVTDPANRDKKLIVTAVQRSAQTIDVSKVTVSDNQ